MTRDSSPKSCAMGIVPFGISDELRGCIKRFISDDLQWITVFLDIKAESCDVEAADEFSVTDIDIETSSVAARISAEPRFYIIAMKTGEDRNTCIDI